MGMESKDIISWESATNCQKYAGKLTFNEFFMLSLGPPSLDIGCIWACPLILSLYFRPLLWGGLCLLLFTDDELPLRLDHLIIWHILRVLKLLSERENWSWLKIMVEFTTNLRSLSHPHLIMETISLVLSLTWEKFRWSVISKELPFGAVQV